MWWVTKTMPRLLYPHRMPDISIIGGWEGLQALLGILQ